MGEEGEHSFCLSNLASVFFIKVLFLTYTVYVSRFKFEFSLYQTDVKQTIQHTFVRSRQNESQAVHGQ